VTAANTIDDFFCKFCGRADRDVLTACPYFGDGGPPAVWVLCADCIARIRVIVKKPGSKLRVADVDMSVWGTA
jgi:hypothetical protein